MGKERFELQENDFEVLQNIIKYVIFINVCMRMIAKEHDNE